jgi:hypothetical protein
MPVEVVFRRVASLYEQGWLEPARQLAMDVLRQAPAHLPTLFSLSDALRELGRFDDALKVLSRIRQIDPANVRAAAAIALTLFYKQDWPRAWRAYDVRFKLMKAPKVTARARDGRERAMQVWRGGAVPASVLVMAEQGFGDIIQFARFLPLVAERAKVRLVAPPVLFPLLWTLDAPVELLPNDRPGSVAGVQAWTPLLHLPRALGLDQDADGLAPKIPYLRAEPERVARRRAQVGPDGFKIGIAWQGNPDKRIDSGRSAPLAAFAPLAEIPGARLISLQKGAGERDVEAVPFAVELHNRDIDIANDGFRETAALIEAVDLTIAVDSAVAHLAGALGRPVLILLKRLGADWRWLFGRDDSVWYPTARLMRQARPGDWSDLLGRVAAEVRRRMTS